MTETAITQVLPRIRSAMFEIASGEPAEAPRWTFRIIAVLFLALALWACVAMVDIVAVAEGRLVPETYVKIVQPTDSGIVREILVHEGDTVHKGQVLVRLDPTESAADANASSRELAMQRLEVRRIDAELKGGRIVRSSEDDPLMVGQAELQGASHRQAHLDAIAQRNAALERAERELSAAREVMAKLELTLPSYERSAAAYEKLASENLVGKIQADEQRRSAVEKTRELSAQRATVGGLEAAVEEARRSLAGLQSSYASDLYTQRLDAVRKINQFEQQQTKAVFKQNNLDLKAPEDGIVKELATTTVGAVVQPGTVLLSLVPLSEPLRAEVAIQNQDIGFVHAGQTVRLKFSAFPFQKYGLMEGTVRTVIADASNGQGSAGNNKTASANTEFTFKAIVSLARQQLSPSGTRMPLAAGMQLSAEIVEDKRTIFEYLLSPVQRVASEAGRER